MVPRHPDIVSHLQDCTFVHPSNSSIPAIHTYVEHIPIFNVIESTVKIEERYGPYGGRNLYAESYLEYLLKFYFPYRGFPDLWVFQPPFHHMTWAYSPKKIRIDLTYLFQMLELHLPSSTDIVFLSDAFECPEQRPAEVAKHFKRFWNISRNERTHETNQLWYSMLRAQVETRDNYHAFLDASKLSCPLLCRYHTDGAHLNMFWYYQMARYVLDAACSPMWLMRKVYYFQLFFLNWDLRVDHKLYTN